MSLQDVIAGKNSGSAFARRNAQRLFVAVAGLTHNKELSVAFITGNYAGKTLNHMKKSLFIATTCLLLSLLACKKECGDMDISDTDVMVIMDYTGTYLRLDGKDYKVCNLEKVASFSDGAKARASFRKIGACENPPLNICETFHGSEGWIEVAHIQ